MSKRTKSIASLGGKLKEGQRRSRPYSLADVRDLAGMRLVFPDLQSMYAAMQEVEALYAITTRKVFLDQPKPDGYRSVHYIILEDETPIEVQLRTVSMDRWATWSHDLLYKNSELIRSLVGDEGLASFRDYAQALSEHQYRLEKGIARPAPRRPDHLEILWEYASGTTRAVIQPHGGPAAVVIHPYVDSDSCQY